MPSRTALTLWLAAASLVFAADNTLTKEEASAGWKLLFDGRSFAGWEDPARKSPPGEAWAIENGSIRTLRAPRIREDLFTLESFEDFELVFDWRVAPRGNSGVKYRIQDRVALVQGRTKPGSKRFEETVDYEIQNRRGDRAALPAGARYEEYTVAFEYQVIDNAGHPDAKSGADRSAGSLYSLLAPLRPAAKPAGEFNHARIVLRGNHVEHWLNGVKVIDAPLDTAEVAAKLAKRWTTSSPVYAMLTRQPKRNTPIVLQHHVDEAWFKNIKIRALARAAR